jgi:hypothetical protein
MKKRFFVLVMAAVLFSIQGYASPDTVYVHSDIPPNEGGLNTAVQTAIDAGTLSNSIFKLDPYGYYILSGTVTVPPDQKLSIVADDPGTTQLSAPPQIILSAEITSWRGVFDVFGDIFLKNVWVLYATTSGAQVSISIEIDDDTLRHKNRGEFEGVIFDYAPIGGAVELRCKHFVGKFTNCYWRNNIDPHYRYYGRSVSYPYQSTAWHTDSITFENCTMANMGYCYMGYNPGEDTPEGVDYAWFNHCTFANAMMHSLEPSFWNRVSVTNCLYSNMWMFGDIRSLREGRTDYPSGGIINIDSIAIAKPSAFPDGAPVETQRHILLANNAYFSDQWIRDYQAGGNIYSDTAGVFYRPYEMPMMTAKTAVWFDSVDPGTGLKVWPYVNKDAIIEGIDPEFIIPPTNQDAIKNFLLGRWATGANIDWAYNIQEDLQGIWPISEDLSYSNSTLQKAGTDGFPVGDLYHWFPAEYSSWKAQSATENTKIQSWLNTGVSPFTVGIKTLQGVPKTYDLAQNYPNPFNPVTTINYSIPMTGHVSLKVYNTLGEEVASLFDGIQQPGNYSATFDGTNLASGVYFYKLQVGTTSLVKKLVLMK